MLGQFNADASRHNSQFGPNGELIGSEDFDRFELVRLLCVRDVLLKSPYQDGSDLISGLDGEYALSIYDEAIAAQLEAKKPADLAAALARRSQLKRKPIRSQARRRSGWLH